jgi:6-pyruvoyltetrahydropterin/6-carboxytetrahydropterin synthase
MLTTITNRYELIAGHWLPKVPQGHKCSRPHGHNYSIDITIGGMVREDGFILDFYDLDKVVKPILDRCDHRMLNDIPGLENPTAENIGAWLVNEIGPFLEVGVVVAQVRVWETPTCNATVTP